MTSADLLLVPLTERRAVLARLLDSYRGAVVSHGWVVRFDDSGFCVRAETDDSNRVVRVRLVGLEQAHLFTREDAERLTADRNVRDGLGRSASPVPYVTALTEALAHLDRVIDILTQPEA